MLATAKKGFYNQLDEQARRLAKDADKGIPITAKVLKVVSQLYEAAKKERDFWNEFFESAYHPPITSEFEFFISRIIYHYSDLRSLKWKLYLRRQIRKTAPDIRIEKLGKTIAVIEVKAKGGWIQAFLSKDRYDYDVLRNANKKTDWHPDGLINNSRNQLLKYQTTFGLEKKNIFFLIPTLKLVHRSRYQKVISDYYDYFTVTSTLPESSFILMSNNMDLDLSISNEITEYLPTSKFETMLKLLSEA